MRLLFLLCLALQVLTTPIRAQQLNFHRLSTEQGLSHGSVTCMLQDRGGFMWIGTKDGLNRFDGYNFIVYEHDPNLSASISNNEIRAIYEDRSGALWIATANGLNKFDKASGAFTHYQYKANQIGSISDNNIKCLYEDRAGTLWIGTSMGLNQLDRNKHTFNLYEPQPHQPNKWLYNAINLIYEDYQGNFWLGTNQGLSRFDRKTSTFSRFPQSLTKTDTLLYTYPVNDLVEEKSGKLWLATSGGGLLEFNPQAHTFKAYRHNPTNPSSLSSNFIHSLVLDATENLWVGTKEQGLNKLELRTGKITRFPPLDNSGNTLNNTVAAIYEDRSHVLWIGTYAGGIHMADLLRKPIIHISYDPGNRNSLGHGYVGAIYADRKSGIWIGTPAGLHRLDRNNGIYTHYTYINTDSSNHSANTASCIYHDRAGRLWIGLKGGGLQSFEPVTKQRRAYLHKRDDPHSLPHSIVNSIYQDKAGILWVATRSGLAKFDSITQQFTPYKPRAVHTETFNISTILEEASGKLWLATNEYGLYQFDPHTTRFTRYVSTSPAKHIAGKKGIDVLFKDHSGILWMGLTQGGMACFNPVTGSLVSFSQSEVLSKVGIMGILEDAKGNLWLSTRKNGIYKYNPQSMLLQNYDASDGLQGNEFLSAACQSPTGELYFGSKNGLNIFHPDSLRDNPIAPPIAITGFKVFDQARHFSKTITLPHHENFISFEFAALSYAMPEKNEYAYQLEGVDKQWIQAGIHRYISYANLDPGQYVFRVKAANHDGVWNEQGTALTITISPPIWRTNLAYFIYLLLIIVFGAAFRRYTINRERLKNHLQLKNLESQKLHELDGLKTKFFANVSHELRTPLTLILSPLEHKLASLPQGHPEEQETKRMHRNANRLLELINQLLDISKLEAGEMALEVRPDDIVHFIQLRVHAFLSLAESKNIQLSFSSSLASHRLVFDQDKLEKIVINLLSNALKFTLPGGKITVTVSTNSALIPVYERQWIVIEVKDTGVGIPADRIAKIFNRFYQVNNSHTREFEGTGIGLALTKELVALHGGKINVVSQPGTGTCFTVELPLLVSNDTTMPDKDKLPVDLFLFNSANEAETNLRENLPGYPDEQAPLLLIVEDNDDLRAYVRGAFQDKYRIQEAINGEEGLQMALDTIPDLIITDWMMPRMDGIELCSKLKRDERTSHIPIILLTAKASVNSRIEGLETGADDYLTKPFVAKELLVRAHNLISQRQKLREHYSRTLLQVTPAIESTPSIAISSLDEKFLARVIHVIETNLSDPEFSIEMMEREVGMSHVHFNRKLKALTNQTPGDLLRHYRLQKAALLLSQRFGNVSQVAYATGFADPAYFARSFRKVYGKTPLEYMASKNQSDIIQKEGL